jgi:conjugative transfer pilus assembly protein TraH
MVNKMKILNKSFFTLLMICCFAATPIAAQASAWDKMKEGIFSSASNGGVFQTRDGTVYSGSSARMRFKKKTVTLLSFTPPKLEVGCNGIDAVLGGLAFANADQIEQLLANIGQGALMAIAMLTMKATCPQCASVIEAVQAAIQAANAFGADACTWAKGFEKMGENILAEKADSDAVEEAYGIETSIFSDISKGFSDTFASPKDRTVAEAEECKELKVKSGEISDYMSGMLSDAGCGVAEAGNWLASTLAVANPASWVSQSDIIGNAEKVGNSAFQTARAMGVINADADADVSIAFTKLFMSAIDVNIKTENKEIQYLAGNDAGTLITALLCGQHIVGEKADMTLLPSGEFPHADKGLTFQECNMISPRIGMIRGCKDPSSTTCEEMQEYKASDDKAAVISVVNALMKPIGSNHGILGSFEAIINKALVQIDNNEKLSGDIIGLMSVSPYPLHKMLNLYAVFGDSALNILDTYTLLMAWDVSTGLLASFVNGASNNKMQGVKLPPNLAGTTQNVFSTAMSLAGKEVLQVGSRLQLMESMLLKIKTMDAIVARSSNANGYLSNAKYSKTVQGSL